MKDKYKEYKKKEISFPAGFTLIELLVVITIFAITGSVVLSILFATFRGSSKAEKLIYLKQSGNTVLSQVTRQIRYAKSLEDPESCPVIAGPSLASVTIKSILDEESTQFSCQGETISSNSASLLDTNIISVTECSFTCTQPNQSEPPTVNFKFKLDAKSTGLIENTGSIPFQASIIMRNFNP